MKKYNRIKLVSIFFILLVLTNFTYANSNQQLSFPITQDQLERYIGKEPSVYGFHIKPEYKAQNKVFTKQETLIPIQDYRKVNFFGVPTITTELRYFEVGQFEADGYTYKLIIYNSYMIEDALALNTQLNSYDSQGNLVDALLLEQRYGYEEFDTFSKFTINQNTINIDEYITYVIEIINGGELGLEIENPVPHICAKRRYKIENGRFKRTLIPITQELFTPFYLQKPYIYASYLTNHYSASTKFHKEDEAIKFPIKGKATDYGYKYLSNTTYISSNYFEVDKFEFEGYTYKLIMYEFSEPEGIQALNTQINSYDSQGNLVDALLLERRYSYHYFTTFSKFTIEQNIVDIDNYILDIFERTDNYKGIGKAIENPVPKLRTKEQYKIDKGKFIPVLINEFPSKYDELIKTMIQFK